MLGFIRAGRAGLSRAAGQNLANVRPVVSIRTQAAAVETKPYFSMEVVDGVAVVRMDQPGSSMNTISVAMQDEFAGVLDEIENNPNINSAVLISAKPGCFVAGADIQMINNVTTAAEGEALSKGGQDMFKRIENSKKKFVAAINGPALGGGLELAWLVTTELPPRARAPSSASRKSCWAFFLAPAEPSVLFSLLAPRKPSQCS